MFDSLPPTISERVESIIEQLAGSSTSLPTYADENELELVLDASGYPVATAEAARNNRQILLEQLGCISDAFREHDVPFVLIKDPYLPKPISDVDILVDDPAAAHTALTSQGFDIEDDTEPHRETYVRTVEGTRTAIDLHLALSWRRVPYLSTADILDECQERVVDGHSVPCPSPEHHLAITAAHSMFKHNSISMFEILETNYLLQEQEPDMAEVRAVARHHNWEPQLMYFLDLVSRVDAELRRYDAAQLPVDTFPLYYPPIRVGWIRARKMIADAADGNLQTLGVSLIAYSFDVTQYLLEQRLGISMKRLFDAISWMKRVVDR